MRRVMLKLRVKHLKTLVIKLAVKSFTPKPFRAWNLTSRKGGGEFFMKYNTYLNIAIAFYAVTVVLSIILMLFNIVYPEILIFILAVLFHHIGIVYVKD